MIGTGPSDLRLNNAKLSLLQDKIQQKKKDDSISVPIELVQSMKQLERRFYVKRHR